MSLTDQAKRGGRRVLDTAQERIANQLRQQTAALRDREFMRELVAKTDNFGEVTWLGHPIWQNVLDLWSVQEAISEIRPDVLIETGTNRGGSALFYAHLFDLMGHGRVVTVDVERMNEIRHPRIEFLIGSSVGEEVRDRMRATANLADGPVLVILDSDHSYPHVAAELAVYHDFVTAGSLLLCQDGIIDELPSMSEARPGPLPAIYDFLADHPEFQIDERYNRRFVVTHHPDGWLRRVR